MGVLQAEQPVLGKVGIGPALMIVTWSTPAAPPLADTFAYDARRFLGQCTLSIRLNQFPPFTPFSRAANMRSVQTDGSAHAHRARTSPACLAAIGTAAGLDSFDPFIPHPSPCVPLLSGRYPASLLVWTL